MSWLPGWWLVGRLWDCFYLNLDLQDWERSIHISRRWCLECWVSQTLPISVNLRKELVCSRAIHCASYIERKEARELRDYEH